ncbi:hypothetical protein CSUB01_09891 [Colletotrichum sublineola]|uniref:Uncharacterized protein n=1 Tax=Colletotrichum sublineola TaxID=1173701 RepID=A0A066XJG2_COLSU|nr:hypothetical protein CSUB01_09891 [Colletotrichum sublineola]
MDIQNLSLEQALAALRNHLSGSSTLSTEQILDFARWHVLRDKEPFKSANPTTKAVAFLLYGGIHLSGHWRDCDMDRWASFFSSTTGRERYPGALLVLMDVAESQSASYCLDIKDICAVSFACEAQDGRSMGRMYLSCFLTYLETLNQMLNMLKTFRNIPRDVDTLRRDVIDHPIEAGDSPKAAVYALGQLWAFARQCDDVEDYYTMGTTAAGMDAMEIDLPSIYDSDGAVEVMAEIIERRGCLDEEDEDDSSGSF